MSSEKKDTVLSHFCAHHAELKALHQHFRMYALIDLAPMDDWLRRKTVKTLDPIIRYPLYGDTGLDSLSEIGPFLIACPDFEGTESLTLHRSLLGLAMRDHRFVSWVWTIHDVEPFIEHLQTLLHARLGPNDEDAWFFFHQPAYLPVLHRELPDEAKRYMFGPCIAWWYLDTRNRLVELAGENLPLPPAVEAFPISVEVVNALHREGAPAQTRAWLKSAMPDLLNQNGANEQMRQLVPLVDKAFSYGITDRVNLGVYSAFALRYGTGYDDHPALQDVLTRFRDTKPTLIDAYAALGDTVWREVQDTAKKRAEEAATLAYQANCQKRGYASTRVRLVNDTDTQKRQIELFPLPDAYGSVVNLGDVSAAVYSKQRTNVAATMIPLPGTQLTVKWINSYGSECTGKAVVKGELPRSESAGLTIVEFTSNHYVYITMHAEEPIELTWEEKNLLRLGFIPASMKKG